LQTRLYHQQVVARYEPVFETVVHYLVRVLYYGEITVGCVAIGYGGCHAPIAQFGGVYDVILRLHHAVAGLFRPYACGFHLFAYSAAGIYVLCRRGVEAPCLVLHGYAVGAELEIYPLYHIVEVGGGVHFGFEAHLRRLDGRFGGGYVFPRDRQLLRVAQHPFAVLLARDGLCIGREGG